VIATARALLFVPGDRPERFAKAASSGADAVVLDLEDAVAPAAKPQALRNVLEWLRAGREAVVRVNATGTATFRAEIEALAGTTATVMLPKSESGAQVTDAHARLSEGQGILPLIETPLGIRDADQIAAATGVVRLALGTIDLAAEIGVEPTSYAAFAYSRGRLVIASAASRLPGPIDGVTTALDDAALLAADLRVARELGFTGKLCIHPRQVSPVNAAFSPSADELDWARRVVDAAADSESGVVVLDGGMIDAPVVTRARRVLDRARS
jgi:citrate lyase subunit beta/citryl-CoA lyase